MYTYTYIQYKKTIHTTIQYHTPQYHKNKTRMAIAKGHRPRKLTENTLGTRRFRVQEAKIVNGGKAVVNISIRRVAHHPRGDHLKKVATIRHKLHLCVPQKQMSEKKGGEIVTKRLCAFCSKERLWSMTGPWKSSKKTKQSVALF
jgi:hypothetical protein